MYILLHLSYIAMLNTKDELASIKIVIRFARLRPPLHMIIQHGSVNMLHMCSTFDPIMRPRVEFSPDAVAHDASDVTLMPCALVGKRA